ncbi:endonuclease NucS [Candidatus Pelagibacter sp.]|nr:endonuclease NucS [Candidatus Pelagibacter sp.]MDC0866155.1 endonuclease NucS [Candidatus Pelagibacter sp.]
MKLEFKKGSNYSRNDVGWICYPEKGPPPRGNWETGYVRFEDNLLIFMNIGVPGTTGHDFANYYDHSNKTIVWYGKPKSHSGQPTFKKLLDGSLTPHFFARWDNKDKMFTHLGVGKIVSFKDGHPCLDGKGNQVTTIELKLNIDDSGEIIPIENQTNVIENRKASTEKNFTPKSSFLLEKHLEDYIIKNWKNIELNQNYDIHKENNKLCTQYQTGSGPLDILAISKDKNEFLVIELKKGRASDIVLGQIQRYMGFIKKNLAENKSVKGLIIALEDDKNLKDALSVAPNIKFMKYEVSFKLTE